MGYYTDCVCGVGFIMDRVRYFGRLIHQVQHSILSQMEGGSQRLVELNIQQKFEEFDSGETQWCFPLLHQHLSLCPP